MKAIKVMTTTDASGQITLNTPLALDKNSRVEVIVLIPEVEIDSDETPKEEILENFRQAWYEAMTAKTIPVSQLWEGIEDV